jgi:hypothetical protein
MATYRQLSVFLKNEPGVLGKLCSSFSRNGLNIIAISVSDTVDHAVVRLIVSNPAKARDLLESHNVLVVETDVLGVQLTDRPGALGEIALKLAKAKVNIEYAYGTAGAGPHKSLVILRVNNLAKAKRIVKGLQPA